MRERLPPDLQARKAKLCLEDLRRMRKKQEEADAEADAALGAAKEALVLTYVGLHSDEWVGGNFKRTLAQWMHLSMQVVSVPSLTSWSLRRHGGLASEP